MAESSSGTADIQSERLTTEISLLEAMYPGRVQYNDRTQEVQYSRGTYNSNSVGGDGGGDGGGSLTLRIPSSYLADNDAAAAAAATTTTTISIPQTDADNGLPEILTARDASGNDIRTQTQKMIKTDLELRRGEEVLDQILMAFDDLVDGREGGGRRRRDDDDDDQDQDHQGDRDGDHGNTAQPKIVCKTVIIWLHHLLATSKRKLATSPTPPSLSGISKPGYPGILIYSGPTELVNAHVRDLRALKWQAFQVRWDSVDEERQRQDKEDMDQEAREMTTEWEFTHAKGKVVEVATMAELVGAIVQETHRQIVLKVLGVK
ncbi:hypothetical protein B0A52_07016 [Exophiala mesophila]|uniref:RWD domain-containing protein n=1 Tax=Exophiala mesophila TaxID=212818 RepID=A0A438MZI4_EXOME|nr:hypothetical protein B0A52_07016 [Exophiala mesophila]